MSELKALIFDVDGTLADNEQAGHRVAFNRAFAESGLDWHWDEDLYDRLLAVFGGKERLRHYIEDFLDDSEAPPDIDTFIREVHARKTRCYVELMKSGSMPLRPGVERLIREAHAAGLKLAIASTTTLENATALLTATLGPESVDWFEVYACGDVVPRKKPAPDVYLYALEKLGLDASECLVIEDTSSGLESARAAGLPVVITANSTTRDQDFEGALLVVDQMGEPERPMKVLAGDSPDARWVDLALLRRLHSRA
ncbi:MAG: HAD family hydrolase [Lysobacterales bacterium]|jgi:HAD superfamily hydrolase (TIGR01509 family)